MLMRALEHVYNNVVVGPGKYLQLCCLRALEHVYIYDVVVPGTVRNYIVACSRTRLHLSYSGPWNMFTTLLLRALEHVNNYVVEVPGTRLHLLCSGLWNVLTTLLLRDLELVYNNLVADPGTCLQLCCLRALEHICGEKPLCVCECSVWRRRKDNIDKQLLASLFGHQPLIINHNNKYIIQSYPCCHLTGWKGGGGGVYSKCLLPKHTSILQYIFAYNLDTMP